MKEKNFKPLCIFSVSLPENITTIHKSLLQFDKFYNNYKYFIIVPEWSLSKFKEQFASRCNVFIVNENKILSYENFLSVTKSFNNDLTIACNLKWYYQQVLKIAFALDGNKYTSEYSFPSVMFDADSILLKKLDWIDDDGCEILYGSLIERYNDYFATLETIFNIKISIKNGFTVQFFTCTKELAEFMKKIILNKIKLNRNDLTSTLISKFMISSIFITFKNIKQSMFSEQEFFGVSSTLYRNRVNQKLIFSFRPWNLPYYLNNFQVRVLELLGYSLITYEKPNRFYSKHPSFVVFIGVLIRDIYFQLKNLIFVSRK